MEETILNDGIYHPKVNPKGWRCRYVDNANILWSKPVNDISMKLNNYSDCFNPELIYQGNDESIAHTSGRPDGRVIINDSDASGFIIKEW